MRSFYLSESILILSMIVYLLGCESNINPEPERLERAHSAPAGSVFIHDDYVLDTAGIMSRYPNDKMTFTPGILPIYHLGEDEYTDIDEVTYAIEGSDGLTLNLTFHSEISIGSDDAVELQVGFPLVVRDARPDGLTRSFVFGLGYTSRF